MFGVLKVSAVFVSLIASQAPAWCAVFTKTYDITAINFNAGPPATVFNGSFTLSFDTSILNDDQLGAVIVNSANLPYQESLELNYFGGDTVTINSANYGPNQTSVTGFAIAIRNATSAAPIFSSMNYYTIGIGGGSTRNGTINLATPVSGVPEPATWAMLILGFGMVGGVMRYRKRSAKVTFA